MFVAATKPLVSVVIPTYNHRDYVLQAVASVLAQTYTDYELILINDGSSDDTATLLKPLARSGRIVYIEQTNQGQASARNRGIEAASGDFIAFLDDDDLWPADKLEWQVKHLHSRPDLGLIGGSCMPFSDSPPSFDHSVDDTRKITFETLFSGNPFHSPGQTLIRTSALKAIGGFDATIWGTEDLDLYMRLSRSTEIEARTRIALLYRLHTNNASKAVDKMMSNGKKTLLKNLPNVAPDKRGTLRDIGFLWLYDYSGKQLVSCAKEDIKAGRVFNGFRQLLKLRVFYAQMLRSPRQMGRRLIADLAPESWQLKRSN